MNEIPSHYSYTIISVTIQFSRIFYLVSNILSCLIYNSFCYACSLNNTVKYIHSFCIEHIIVMQMLRGSLMKENNILVWMFCASIDASYRDSQTNSWVERLTEKNNPKDIRNPWYRFVDWRSLSDYRISYSGFQRFINVCNRDGSPWQSTLRNTKGECKKGDLIDILVGAKPAVSRCLSTFGNNKSWRVNMSGHAARYKT